MLVWALAIPLLRVTQQSVFPGGAHWIVRVLHRLLGVGVMPVVAQLMTQLPATPVSGAGRTRDTVSG